MIHWMLVEYVTRPWKNDDAAENCIDKFKRRCNMGTCPALCNPLPLLYSMS